MKSDAHHPITWVNCSTFDCACHEGRVRGSKYRIQSKDYRTWIVAKEVLDKNGKTQGFSSFGNDLSYPTKEEAARAIESGAFDKDYYKFLAKMLKANTHNFEPIVWRNISI